MSPRTPHPMWGWIAPARGMMAFLAASAALGLIAVSPRASGPAGAIPSLVVDPNTAPVEILVALPRLGPVLAGRIVEARESRPFRSIEDLDARVKGIGPATVAALKPYLRIGPDDPPSPSSRKAPGAP